MLARAIAAINDEVTRGTGMTPNEAMAAYLESGKQGTAKFGPLTQDQQRAVDAANERARQKQLVPGTRVRRVNRARQKTSLAGKMKMESRWSQEIYEIDKVVKRGADTDTMSLVYRLRRTNGQDVKGDWKREELQLVVPLTTEWHGRAIAGKWKELADDDIVPGLDANGEPERTGETWAEEQIEAIPVGERKGKTYEQLLGRLVQYLRSGQDQDAALDRLKRSLSDAPINTGELAVLGKDS